MVQDNKSNQKNEAVMILEDGTIFTGYGFGAPQKTHGEIVFSTSMVGYPESLTDPSYKGQILTLTYPLIGNYGVPSSHLNLGLPLYFESDHIQVSGLAIHELCRNPNHWASSKTLDKWLVDEGVPGIFGIDTRRLTKKLRIHGVMLGILQVCTEGEDPKIENLSEETKSILDPNSTDLVGEVTVKEPIHHNCEGNKKVVMIDCGSKYSIIRNLLKRGISVVRTPYDFTAKEILEYKPDGVIISNGPGDPKRCTETIATVRELIDLNTPMMGICLGNQILTLASGGDTYKMKFGHRSQNQPALDLKTNRCYITTQNHGYSVKPESLDKTELETWFLNANDKTIEGVKHLLKPIFAVQWHPEGSPGPYDTEFLFNIFSRMMEVQ